MKYCNFAKKKKRNNAYTKRKKESQNIRDLYHDITKTIIREGRLRESEISCAKAKKGKARTRKRVLIAQLPITSSVRYSLCRSSRAKAKLPIVPSTP